MKREKKSGCDEMSCPVIFQPFVLYTPRVGRKGASRLLRVALEDVHENA